MSRSAAARGGLTLVLIGLAAPVAAADWKDDFRGGYAADWQLPEDDPISIELGARYWYALGAHRMTVLGDSYAVDDTSHILEGYLRINDHESDFYAKGIAGYSAVINSSYATPSTGGTIQSQSGTIHYLGADIGYMPVGNDEFRFGGFLGYQYWNDSPDMGREVFTTAGGGGDSEINNIQYQLVRLGLAGRAELGDSFDVTAEAAVVPYALLGGTYGAFVAPAIPGDTQGSAGNVSGWLYGAAGEIMARYHPTENWTIGLGARAWYLTGQADVTFQSRDGGNPSDATNWITKTTNFSTLRYGLLGEVSYRF